ncbi:hypothetical protein [Parachitinimonas caeni]|uniref:CdiI immunity protein domain-containing protein n=1 Tax=Parachitinimonas caeni TaxID=3031301 RepID=A0ABT7E3U4_9NEIS|nr:hypothetical protein [Parachitinimonas caeni]MDK2126994.1 hypothetical protein [Parachitinimonas caeni]
MNQKNYELEKKLGASLLGFLEPFNEYDREERAIELFGSVDPNDENIFRDLLKRHFFEDAWFGNLEKAVRLDMKKSLDESLQNVDFDYEWVVSEFDGTFGLPSTWSVKNFRYLFEIIHSLVSDYW